MTRSELFKLLHVAGAIAWVGGGLGLLVLSRSFLRAKDYAGLLAIGRQSQALGTRLFMPAALVTIGFGIALVATETAYGFTDLWIIIGYGGIVASGVMQSTVAEPASKRFLAHAAEHGTEDPGLEAVARRLVVGSTAEVGLLLVVVWAMVAKPVL